MNGQPNSFPNVSKSFSELRCIGLHPTRLCAPRNVRIWLNFDSNITQDIRNVNLISNCVFIVFEIYKSKICSKNINCGNKIRTYKSVGRQNQSWSNFYPHHKDCAGWLSTRKQNPQIQRTFQIFFLGRSGRNYPIGNKKDLKSSPGWLPCLSRFFWLSTESPCYNIHHIHLVSPSSTYFHLL